MTRLSYRPCCMQILFTLWLRSSFSHLHIEKDFFFSFYANFPPNTVIQRISAALQLYILYIVIYKKQTLDSILDIVRFVMWLVHEVYTVDVCVTVGVCVLLWLCNQILPVSGWTRPCWPVMGAVGRKERVWRYWVWQTRALQHLPAEHWIPLHIARGTCKLFKMILSESQAWCVLCSTLSGFQKMCR